MKIRYWILVSTLVFLIACKKAPALAGDGLHRIYLEYKFGQIDECKLAGQKVYVAMHNWIDGPTTIYSTSGDVIAVCNFGWGPVDSNCDQLSDCKIIYRAGFDGNEPSIDIYNLKK